MSQALVACNIMILKHYSSFTKRRNARLHHGIRGVGTYGASRRLLLAAVQSIFSGERDFTGRCS